MDVTTLTRVAVMCNDLVLSRGQWAQVESDGSWFALGFYFQKPTNFELIGFCDPYGLQEVYREVRPVTPALSPDMFSSLEGFATGVFHTVASARNDPTVVNLIFCNLESQIAEVNRAVAFGIISEQHAAVLRGWLDIRFHGGPTIRRERIALMTYEEPTSVAECYEDYDEEAELNAADCDRYEAEEEAALLHYGYGL